MHLVEIEKERPDFRVFIDLLYGADRNVDTDGDSDPVYSRAWTYLYIKDRESDDPLVEIFAMEDRPSVFAVESASDRLEELAALYLFMACGRSISTSSHDQIDVSTLKDTFREELLRATNSVWHRSSPELPYPNRA